MMKFIRWLIFIKRVSQVVKRFKKIVKRLKRIVIKIVIKKIVLIEKDCDKKKDRKKKKKLCW